MARRAGPGLRFVDAYAEIGGTDHPGVAVVRAEKAWMREPFVGPAREAGATPADVVGAQLHLLYEGVRRSWSPQAGGRTRCPTPVPLHRSTPDLRDETGSGPVDGSC